MNEGKGLKFVSMIPYIIISIILLEIGVVMYDVFIKENVLTPAEKRKESSVTLVLSDTVGTTTIEGKEIVVEITGKNYGKLSCSSDNEEIAKCKIEDNKLYVLPQQKTGVVSIKVKESKENETISLQFKIEKNKDNNYTAKVETTQPATTTVVNHTPVKTPVVTTSLSLSGYIGGGYVNGNDVIIEVYGSNYGQLSCSSSDEKIAKCRMQNNVLIVSPQSIVGTAYITVKESRNSKTIVFQLNVKKEYECSEGTLIDDNSRGYICLADGYEDYEQVCTRYHTTQNESGPLCVDEDITGAYNDETLIIGCTKDKHTDATYGCTNQHLCIITEIKKTCTDYNYKSTYKCPEGFNRYSGYNETLKCYKKATLKK